MNQPPCIKGILPRSGLVGLWLLPVLQPSWARKNFVHMRGLETRPFLLKCVCRWGLLSLLAAATLTALPQKTSTILDSSYSFSEHKRYSWRENRLLTRQHPDTNEEMDRKIVRNVNQLLSAAGFVEVKEKPDLYIFYDGGGDLQAGVGSVALANSAPLSPTDPASAYGLGNGPALAPASWLKVNGRLVFHMIDAESKKSVWQTTYTKTFRDPNKAIRNLDKEVNQLVSKSFKDFPPKSKKQP